MNGSKNSVELVVFDMAGTTVDDNIEGVPLVMKSYHDAFTEYGVNVSYEILNNQRGRDKLTVIKEYGGKKHSQIYAFFIETLLDNVDKVKEIEGVSDVFKFLKEKNIIVTVNTGFPEEVARPIIDKLRWEETGLLNSWICSEMVGVSRPDPAMIKELMKRHKISDPHRVIKIDDTEKGLQAGVNAGVITIGVLTGTQNKTILQKAKPNYILDSVKSLPSYLKNKELLIN